MVGIVNQMRWEQESARELGLTWDVRVFCPVSIAWNEGWIRAKKWRLARQNIPVRLVNFLLLRIGYYRWMLRESRNYDIVIARYSYHDPFQWLISRLLAHKLCFVHHTLEEKELALAKGGAAHLNLFMERIFGRSAIRGTVCTIGVTREITEYETERSRCSHPVHVYANGIVYPIGIATDRAGAGSESNFREFIFIASYFYPWHGLDLLLADIAKSCEGFTLHVVGEMSPNDLDACRKDSRIRIHGVLNEKQINELMKRCSVGIASLAMERNEMMEATPLKVREYLRGGLAVYSNYSDVFPDDYLFYRKGPVSIGRIIQFANDISTFKRAQISESARPFIEKKKMVADLYPFLSRIRAAGDIAR